MSARAKKCGAWMGIDYGGLNRKCGLEAGHTGDHLDFETSLGVVLAAEHALASLERVGCPCGGDEIEILREAVMMARGRRGAAREARERRLSR